MFIEIIFDNTKKTYSEFHLNEKLLQPNMAQIKVSTGVVLTPNLVVSSLDIQYIYTVSMGLIC